MIGLARCAYEVGNYKECDYWYGTVFNKDIELARKYSYLGAFQSTSGRSFSLADRLENTVWISSSSDTSVVKPVEEALQPVENQVATQTTDVQVKTTKPEAPAESLEDLAPLVAVVPANIEEEKEPLCERPLYRAIPHVGVDEIVLQNFYGNIELFAPGTAFRKYAAHLFCAAKDWF